NAPVVVAVVQTVADLPRPPSAARDDPRHWPEHDEAAYRGNTRRGQQHALPAPAPKLIAVAPRRHLRSQRVTDAHQLETFPQLGETDVVGGDAKARAGEEPLALLDRLPALLERCQIPALA